MGGEYDTSSETQYVRAVAPSGVGVTTRLFCQWRRSCSGGRSVQRPTVRWTIASRPFTACPMDSMRYTASSVQIDSNMARSSKSRAW